MPTPIEAILTRLPGVKREGRDWVSSCPAHEDSHAPLRITIDVHGQMVIQCDAGCPATNILDAIGLDQLDLAPHASQLSGNDVNINVIPAAAEELGLALTSQADEVSAQFTSEVTGKEELERRHGTCSGTWLYTDARGEPVGLVLRWDLGAGKKAFRRLSRRGGSWCIGGMSEPQPLYALPDLHAAQRVYFCQGEKAAEAIRMTGLTGTTAPYGPLYGDRIDWSPLAGKEVIILPANDPLGQRYAETVAARLAAVSPVPAVKILKLPGLPHGEDAFDFVTARSGVSGVALRQVIESLADDATLDHVIEREEHFRPFPLNALPQPVRKFVAASAKAIGCDPSFLALPLITALASAIGTTRRLQLKRGWTVPAIIWTAIVGESGTAKTPAFKLVMAPFRERQRKALEHHAEAMRQHERELASYERAMNEWKRDKKTIGEPPEKPSAPTAERFIVSDTTVEALAPLLLENPRGVLLSRDELAGWLGSFDRYGGGKVGADAAHWLSMHVGEGIIVDRKTGNPRTIYVPEASVSVCGGIQPAVLNRALGVEHRESGLAARLLLACPPRQAKRWTEADIDPALQEELARLINRLYELQPADGNEGMQRPVVIGLAPDAKTAWTVFYNAHAAEQANLNGDLAAAWSKLEEYAARMALVIHFVRWAAGDPSLKHEDLVDVESMKAGIILATWFKGETQRVYSMLGETEASRDRRRLVEWIARRANPVTSRDVQMGCRWLREAGVAESALEELVKSGWGKWQSSPTGRRGQPTRYFHLSVPSAVNSNGVFGDENSNTVDVDDPEATETPAESDSVDL